MVLPLVEVPSVINYYPEPLYHLGPMILMEFCEAGKLSDWVKNIKSITDEVEDQMLDVCRGVASGMSHLHNNQVIHTY